MQLHTLFQAAVCEGERAVAKERGRGCSRDGDRWLSMTLTMKERFSSEWTHREEGEEETGGAAPCALRTTLLNPEHVCAELKPFYSLSLSPF